MINDITLKIKPNYRICMENSPTTKVHYIQIDPEYADQRIDNFLTTYLKGVPKTRIYRILRKGEVRVNKKRAQPSYRLQAGDEIRIPPVRLADRPESEAPSKSVMSLLAERILFEDKNLLIINKPSGIPVHGGSGVKLGIIEALRAMYPKLPNLELVHRLDLGTSGCLILAKKRSILKELHEVLRNGEMHKKYLTLTKGHWRKDELRVDVPLQKNQMSSGERIVKVHEEGKAALTEFKPLKTFDDSMLLEVTLHTGRTHQIRVHAQYRGHPVAGDDKYGDREFNKLVKQKGLKRLFLHAHSLEFVLPATGQTIRVTAPLDADLEKFLDSM